MGYIYFMIILCTKSLLYYRSDHQAIIEGLVLEVIFEFSTDAYVYKYQDLTSKSIEYIAIEELSACEWFVKRVPKGKPVQIEVMAEIQKKQNPLKPTKSNKNPKLIQIKLT